MTNDAQDFLHPMNRARSLEEMERELGDPNFTPPGYPPLEEVRSVAPSPEDKARMALLREKARQLWPTLSDFLGMVYEEYVESTPWRTVFEPRRIVPPGG